MPRSLRFRSACHFFTFLLVLTPTSLSRNTHIGLSAAFVVLIASLREYGLRPPAKDARPHNNTTPDKEKNRKTNRKTQNTHAGLKPHYPDQEYLRRGVGTTPAAERRIRYFANVLSGFTPGETKMTNKPKPWLHSIIGLTIREKICLHLEPYTSHYGNKEIVRHAMTQDGIAWAIGIGRAHASLVLSEAPELFVSSKRTVEGSYRKRLIYTLTPLGMEFAAELKLRIEKLGRFPIESPKGPLEPAPEMPEDGHLIQALTYADAAKDMVRLRLNGQSPQEALYEALKLLGLASSNIAEFLVESAILAEIDKPRK